MHFKKGILAIALPIAVALTAAASFAAIGATARANTPRRPSAAGATTTIGSRHTKAGSILVSPRGQILFLFNQDRRGMSACYGACAREWRPLRAYGRVVAKRRSGVKQRWLSTSRRSGGIVQVTYDHSPLYVHVGNRPGSLRGDNTNDFGGRWYAMPISGVKTSTP